jgi:hypothetical protein
MLRFRLSTFLGVVAVAGVWLATVSFERGYQIRALIWFLVVVTAIASAIQYRGPRRWFWFGMVLILSLRFAPQTWPIRDCRPDRMFSNPIQKYVWHNDDPMSRRETTDWFNSVNNLLNDTVDLAVYLIIGAACGAICAAIYRDANREDKNGSV